MHRCTSTLLQRWPRHYVPVGRRLSSVSAAKRCFDKDGFVVIPQVLSQELVAELNAVSDELVKDDRYKHLQEDEYTGSLIPVTKHEAFAKLIAHAGALDVLRDLQLAGDIRWMSGFLISKPPRSPSLGWHQDGWYWNDECAYQAKPAQIFAMYYLTDTTLDNGCLRAIPGSHTAEQPLHSALGKAHSDEVRSTSKTDWQTTPEHQSVPGEVNICVRAGDLVVGDARVLHGARRNQTDQRRSLITLWYIPEYSSLSEGMQNGIIALHNHQCGELYQGRWGELALQMLDERGLLPGEALPPASGKENEYDHNLDIMHRQPGFVQDASDEARAAWKQAASSQS